ncbi:hypothetical protein [Kocuria atrinae]|uniref:hypothetical protein n=1 Tax=Kocuria atrinae TaxID=592377 RepID=UPI0003199402|nr:hypothetical protein [Kocuria atrinae]
MPSPSDRHSDNRLNGQSPTPSRLKRILTFFVVFFLTLTMIRIYRADDLLATSSDLGRAFVVIWGLFIMVVYFLRTVMSPKIETIIWVLFAALAIFGVVITDWARFNLLEWNMGFLLVWALAWVIGSRLLIHPPQRTPRTSQTT